MQYVQIETWQALLGIAAVVFTGGAAWGTLRNEIKNIGGGLKELKGNFDSYIQSLALKAAAKDGESKSPLRPSDSGKLLLSESGAGELIAQRDFKDWLFPMVDALAPKTDFEAEQKVLQVLLHTKDDSRWNPVKEYIFNHPIFGERPLTVERLLAVVSWVLRDEYITSRSIKR